MVLVTFAGSGHGFARTSVNTLIPVIVVFMLVFRCVGYVYSGPRVTQLMSLSKRIAWSRWKNFLSRHESSAFRIDATILRFSRHGRRVVFGSLAAFVAGWILLGFESYVILRILGQDVSVGQGFLMEGTASLLRIAFFFIPSAFGAVEAAYVSLIASFGVCRPGIDRAGIHCHQAVTRGHLDGMGVHCVTDLKEVEKCRHSSNGSGSSSLTLRVNHHSV